MGKQKLLLRLSVSVFLVAGIAAAQVTTASISGTVKDSSGAVLPGAQVVVLNEDTGVPRTVQSDTEGRYLAPLLALGNYRVTVTQQGFQTEVRSGIVLTVGRDAVVDIAMSVGAVTQTLEVSAEAATIDTTSATIAGLVSGAQMRELPLNGRSYTDLALLNPGVIYNRLATGSSPSDGFGVRLSVNASRSDQVLYLVDGTYTNNASDTGGSVTGQSLGIEGIREFQVLTHDFSAEYGRAAGGVVSVVTRSGTNQFHGSLYEFLRNSDVDARDWTPTASPLQPLRRNQFGGSVGGPVKKDRIFFFSNYEGLRWRQGVALQGTTFDAAGILSGADLNPTTKKPYVVNPIMIPYLNLYPKVNGVFFGDGTGSFSAPISQPTGENYNMERVDVRLSDKDNMYARGIYDPSTRTRINPIPNWSLLDQAASTFAVLGETHIFSANAINDFRAAFNRTFVFSGLGPEIVQTPANLSFVPGLPIGRITLTGGGSSGGNATSGVTQGSISAFGNIDGEPLGDSQNVFQETDSFSWTRGSHSFKFGGDVERIQNTQTTSKGLRGAWIFPSVSGFLAGTPSQLQGRITGPLPIGGTGQTIFGYRRSLFAWFAQDTWRVSSRLTVTLGLRHEFLTDPTEVHDHIAQLVNLSDSASIVGRSPFNTAKLNFAPRVGAAWDPTGSGKNAVRFGAGIYYNQVDGAEWIREITDYHFAGAYTLNFPTGTLSTFPLLPAPTASLLAGAATEQSIESQLATPTVIHYGLDYQRQLTSTMSAKLGYVGWYGYHMTRLIAGNTLVPTTVNGAPFYPNVGAGGSIFNTNFSSTDDRLLTNGNANYNGLQAVLQKTAGASMFQLSYVYSHALSEVDSTQPTVISNSGQYGTDPADPARDYGRSAYDQRHTLVFNGQYQFTALDQRLHSRMEKSLLGGWAVNGIWQYGSGIPLTISPGYTDYGSAFAPTPAYLNLLPGFSNNPTSGMTAGCNIGGVVIPPGKLGTPGRWFDPCAFAPPPTGTFGDLGRDTVNGPGFNVTNFTFVKNTAVTEKIRLQLRVEIFNLFNHPNWALPSLTEFSRASSGVISVSPSAGQVSGTTSNARQIQFGLKLMF